MPLILGQYIRDVLLRQFLSRRASDCGTYVRLKSWGNRYFYLLLRVLSSQSYPCVVGADRPWMVRPSTFRRGMDRYARLAFTLPHVRFSSRPPVNTENKVFVHDGAFPELERQPWRARIRIEHDFSLPSPTDCTWRVLPLLMHPLMYATGQDRSVERLRTSPRTIRVFFAGNLDEDLYTSSRALGAIRTRFDILDRPTVIHTLVDGLRGRVQWVGGTQEWENAKREPPARRLVMAGRGGFRLSASTWLETLSHCDVFLAPPGAFFPLCHNLVEAMAVGCIPLTNYPDWHDPPLQHMRNCIAFTTAEDLLEKARMVLDMDNASLERMRREVICYYDENFDADSLAGGLLQNASPHMTLFVVTDNQKYCERVTRESVLFASQARGRTPVPIKELDLCHEA